MRAGWVGQGQPARYPAGVKGRGKPLQPGCPALCRGPAPVRLPSSPPLSRPLLPPPAPHTDCAGRRRARGAGRRRRQAAPARGRCLLYRDQGGSGCVRWPCCGCSWMGAQMSLPGVLRLSALPALVPAAAALAIDPRPPAAPLPPSSRQEGEAQGGAPAPRHAAAGRGPERGGRARHHSR